MKFLNNFSCLFSYWSKRLTKNCPIVNQLIAIDTMDMPVLNVINANI